MARVVEIMIFRQRREPPFKRGRLSMRIRAGGDSWTLHTEAADASIVFDQEVAGWYVDQLIQAIEENDGKPKPLPPGEYGRRAPR